MWSDDEAAADDQQRGGYLPNLLQRRRLQEPALRERTAGNKDRQRVSRPGHPKKRGDKMRIAKLGHFQKREVMIAKLAKTEKEVSAGETKQS